MYKYLHATRCKSTCTCTARCTKLTTFDLVSAEVGTSGRMQRRAPNSMLATDSAEPPAYTQVTLHTPVCIHLFTFTTVHIHLFTFTTIHSPLYINHFLYNTLHAYTFLHRQAYTLHTTKGTTTAHLPIPMPVYVHLTRPWSLLRATCQIPSHFLWVRDSVWTGCSTPKRYKWEESTEIQGVFFHWAPP